MRVRDSYPVFTEFVEAYYEYLEVDMPVLQDGRVVQRAKNLNSYRDVDTTLDDFAELLFREFLALIPHDSQVDKRMLLKHVKDFYRARGTEKSYRFLLRILSDEENPGDLPVDFYYPKLDILRASDGKWYIQKTLRLFNLRHDNNPISEQDINLFLEFAGEQIRGATSNAAAIVDKAEHFFEQGVLIDEVTLSSIRGTFEGGETVSASYQDDDGVSHSLTATVLDGVVNRIILRNGGTGYSVGDEVIFDPTNGGSGAEAIVESVTSGGIANVTVISGGAGFKVGNPLLFTGSSGSGANGSVVTVDTSGFVHPNTYIIESSTISLEANTQIGNTVYSNLNSANANSTISNAINTFIFANTGPVLAITMAQQGNNYLTLPNIDVVANTRVKALGILGKLTINDGGTGYAIGDELVFTNVIGGHGVGARANVTAIDGDGTITAVRFQQMGSHIIGGTGYENNFLPTVTVSTVGGSGANIAVSTILGDGESLQAGVTSIGTILSFLIISGGSGYNTAPTVNLTQSGDGTALANATVLSGVFSYPGRYLNDDGHLSSFNFLQDAHYYQNYSYVVRVKNSLVNYKKAVKDILHPAGMKLFGEFLYVANTINLPLITTSNVEHDIEEVYCTEAAQFDASPLVTMTTNVAVSHTVSMWINLTSLPTVNQSIVLLSDRELIAQTNSYLIVKNTADANSATGVHFEYVGLPNNASTMYVIKSRSDIIPIYTNTFFNVIATINRSNVAQSKIIVDGIDTTQVTIEANSVPVSANFTGYMTEFVYADAVLTVNQLNENQLPANVYATVPSANLIAVYKGNTTNAVTINVTNFLITVANSIAVTTNTTPSNI